jgi:preprotein translocase subunit SecY
MKVKEFAEKLDMKILTEESKLDRMISGVYVCDLLSWVMSHANKDNIWITIHTHLNIVAVALDTVKQIESQMLMRHYKGFLE